MVGRRVMVGSSGRYEQGAALVIVLLFMVVTLILITAVMAVTSNEVQIAGLHRDGVRALELAHAGLQEATQRISRSHDFASVPQTGMDKCPDDPDGSGPLTGSTPLGFVSSLVGTPPANPNLLIGICGVGTSNVLEIRADARVGTAVRRVSQIARISATNVPPEVVIAATMDIGGSADIAGATYSPLSVEYSKNPDVKTFAAWRIGDGSTWCYGKQATPGGCPQDNPKDNWFPGTRRAISATNPATDDIAIAINAWAASHQSGGCPESTGPTDNPPTLVGVKAESTNPSPVGPLFRAFGWDPDVPPPVWVTGDLPQAKTIKRPCGLPYEYVQDGYVHYVYKKVKGTCDYTSPADFQHNSSATPLTINGCLTTPRPFYVKTVIFEQWFDNYLRFSGNKLVPRDGSPCVDDVCVVGSSPPVEPKYAEPPTPPNPPNPPNPLFASIPPFPSECYLGNIAQNANVRAGDNNPTFPGPPDCTGIDPNPKGWAPPKSTVINKGDYDLGTPPPPGTPPSSCPIKGGDPRLAYFTEPPGPYKFASGMEGNGLLVIEGDAELAGGFTYWGTMIVKGNLTFGGGTVTINGGLIVLGNLIGTGNLFINGSNCIGATVFTSNPIVESGAMWER